ncbi:MAG: hypothetical protein AAF530_19875 [Pseudomonadota bacterium]
MKLLYAGFDTLDVAFQGALHQETLEVLEQAKGEASKRQEMQLVAIGPEHLEAHVADHGIRGGYAYMLDTGPLGEKWFIKNNSDPTQWNLLVRPHAATLATLGYKGLKERLRERLKAMGCRYSCESISRADFAMDFLMPRDFELNLDQFVAHRRSAKRPYWGSRPILIDQDHVNAVIKGRRLESVTIGKMPGRQVIVYDKRLAALEKRTLYWFKIWEIDPEDDRHSIWRVEFRAGKRELKDRWQITSYTNFETSIGDVYSHMADRIRYLDDFQSDSNISRQCLHPLWTAANSTLEKNLFQFRSGLLPHQVREVEREQLIDLYWEQIRGLTAGLSVALGNSDAEVIECLGHYVGTTIDNMICDKESGFWKSRERAEKRLRFI